MKYLVDSDMIIDQLRGRRKIDSSLIKDGIAMSIISQAELIYGAYKSDRVGENLTEIKETFEDLGVEVITLNDDIVSRYARIKAGLETKGKRLDDFDLLIGATAISEDLTLVTRNIKHYQRIPRLKLRQ